MARRAAAMSSDATRSAAAPRARGSGASAVYDALKRDILDMALAPGDPLDELGLSARFAMSRTPVREALVKLVAEGLATTLPNRNTIVSAIDLGDLPGYFDALTLMYRVTTRLAAERHDPADLKALKASQAAFAEAVAASDAIAMIETNRLFHLAIARCGGNKYYADMFSRLLNEGTRLLRLYYRTYGDRLPQQYVDEHEGLIAAIAARDVALADRLAGEHARQIVRQIQNFLNPTTGAAITL